MKPPVQGPRPLLVCFSWECDSYEKQRGGDPKSLLLNLGQRVEQPRRRWKQPRRSLRSQGLSPLRSAASNRQLLRSAPARKAAGEALEPPLCARGGSWCQLRLLPSALGQRLPVELRVRERSGKWRRLSRSRVGGEGGARRAREEGKRRWLSRPRAVAGCSAARSGGGCLAGRCSASGFGGTLGLLLATGATPGTAAGCCRGLPEVGRAGWYLLPGAARSRSTHPASLPPRGAHVPPPACLQCGLGSAARPPPSRAL